MNTKNEKLNKLCEKVNDTDWIWVCFWIIFILSLWAVFSWGFHWIPLIEIEVNPDIVTGTLALSYSYLAGCIIYFLTSLLPKYKKKRSSYKYLVSEVHDMGTEFHNTLEIFKGIREDAAIVDFDNFELCKEFLLSKRWGGQIGIQMSKGVDTYFKYLQAQTLKISSSAIDMIAKYKEILTGKWKFQ